MDDTMTIRRVELRPARRPTTQFAPERRAAAWPWVLAIGAVLAFAAIGRPFDPTRADLTRHDRVLIVTDEQYTHHHQGDPTEQIPADVPVYTWNLAGYRAGHGPSGTGNRHTFGGLSDAAFRMVPLIEASRDADWPWVA